MCCRAVVTGSHVGATSDRAGESDGAGACALHGESGAEAVGVEA